MNDNSRDISATRQPPPHEFAARRARSWLMAATVALLASADSATAVDSQLISIGTGSTTGVYYIAGGAICELVNKSRWELGIRCLAESTSGSIENLRGLRSGELTLGIVQSDWQAHAVAGTDIFSNVGPNPDLRSVFSLFPEPFTVVARPNSEISSFADLRGKRVNIGPVGSGSRATIGVVMRAMGWSETDFAYVSNLGMGELSRALCGGEIDAAVFIVAHPNLTVEDMRASCDAQIVPLEGPVVDKLVADHPSYFRFEIPPDTYRAQPTGTPTFALAATLVTSRKVAPAIVYEVTAAVFGNFDEFRTAHPAFIGLSRSDMVREGLSAPLHYGATRYFEEFGLR